MKKFLHLFSTKAIGLLTGFVFLFVFANAQVVNTTHPANSPYATIQAAIDDAITINGDIITVGSGTYNESINITKSVNLRGVQADNCAVNRTGAESIISCPNGIGVNASNVTINGFTIQNQDGANAALAPGYGFAVYMVPPNTGTQLLNNIIRNNTLGTGLSNAGATPAQAKISCNWYDANNTPGPIFREAVYADDDISGGTVKNVLIDNNKFSNHVEGVGIDFEMSTAATAATGITMTNNVFDGNLRAVTFYNVASSTFSNNEIKNSTFGVASADLRIFGGANNLIVSNNSFDGSNALAPHAIRMTSVVGPNTNISIFENSFTGYSPNNTVFLDPQAYTGGPIPATCNWFGTTDAATIASIIGSPVSYIPYLTNGTDASPSRGFQPVPGSCNGSNQPPSITCPQGITLDCSFGIPDPDIESVIVSGFCTPITVTWEGDAVTNQTCVSSFTILRTYKATDACGNIATCTQTINIVDNTAPTLTVPANVTLQCNDTLPLMPLNINSSPNFIDGTYNVGTAVFGAPLTATPVTADAVLVNDGIGGAGNPYDACESIMNDLTGKIAVIERSGCVPPASYFVTKANKAQLAGAVGVIFIFNQPGNQIVTMGLPAGPNPTINIPLMLVSNNYGNILKVELLAGPVNVSLSAPTVIATDACSFATITHQQTFTPGNCPSSYTLVNTWTATDLCGNATTASQTITVADNTAPTLTVPANVTLQCSDPLPLMPLNINSSPNFIDGTYNIGTAVFGAPLTSTPVTADAILVNDGVGGAGNPYDACESIINDLTGKIAVIERSGCVPPASYFVTKANKAQLAGAVGVIFIFNQPGDQIVTMGLPAGPNPTINIPLMLVSNNYGNILKAELLAGPVNVSFSAPTVIATDACSFATITHQQTFTPGNCPSSYTLVNTWTATDQCGNATTASQTITVADNTAPALTVPANITLQCIDPLPLEPLHINSSVNNQPGTYNVGTAVFGAPLTSTPLTANAVMVIDNAGNPYDACETITNNLTGKIAVIERSGCIPPNSYFITKAYKAQLAGAIGVIFISNVAGDQVFTMGLPAGPNPTITIPLMLVSNAYGNTLKAAILAGPVNVSLSAPTVIASDACSFTSITHTTTTTPGNCSSNYTIVKTWTATDQCGNATTASQTITVVDNTAPVVTKGTIGSCYVSVAAAQAAAIAATTATDNCSNALIKTASTSGTCSAVITVTVADGCGNNASVTYNTRIDNTPPTVTTGTIASCYTTVAAAQAAAIAATTATDNCPGTITKTASTSGTCSAVITVTVTDGCGNIATKTYNTRIDNTPPTVTTGTIASCYTTVAAAQAAAIAATTATDNCPGTITKTASTSGTCSAVITVTATDGCGKTATVTYNTRIDNIPPTVTGGTIASCYTTVAVAQAAAIAATTATDNCPGTITKTASTSGTCSAVITVTVADGCGNIAIKTYNTRIDNTPPTVTTGSIASCYTTVAAAQAAAIAATTATDNCPGILTKSASTSGTCSAVITVTVADGCGNITIKTYTTRIDNTLPVITCKANQTRLTNNGYCTYTAVGTEFNVLSATDNCPGVVGLSYTLSGATSGSGINTLNGATFNTGITTVTWKATDGCGNFATCSFNITVNDVQNSTGYIIYAKSSAKFGEENDINGDVGVTDANGSAEFKKNTDLNPFFVKARNITVQLPANVSNRFYTPATGGPNPPFMIYNGTGGSGTLNANVNGTYNGNYKNLTVKKGITATFTGNDFGKIKIEEGANVTFTAPAINLQELNVEKGKKNVNTTDVYFVNPTSVKVSEKVTVEEDCMINVNGPKVTFYLGDSKKDEEKFIVTGDNTMITLNIMIPNGKLKVSGGPRYGTMTGWFITEKIESDGKKTIWNKYDCSATPQFAKVSSENIEPQIEKPIEVETPVVVDQFAVKVYPNPTPGDFNIQVITKSNEPIMVRIMDVSGTVVQASTKLAKQGLIALANRLPGGTYFVEVTQGKDRSVTKLVKLN